MVFDTGHPSNNIGHLCVVQLLCGEKSVIFSAIASIGGLLLNIFGLDSFSGYPCIVLLLCGKKSVVFLL